MIGLFRIIISPSIRSRCARVYFLGDGFEAPWGGFPEEERKRERGGDRGRDESRDLNSTVIH